MSQLPPCSGRPGIVRAPSWAILDFRSPVARPACVLRGCGGCATMRLRCVCVEMSSASRLFQVSRTEAEGAQPRTVWSRVNFSLLYSLSLSPMYLILMYKRGGGGEREKEGILTSWVNQACESDPRNVSGTAEDTFEIPYRFCSFAIISIRSLPTSQKPVSTHIVICEIFFKKNTYGSG